VRHYNQQEVTRAKQQVIAPSMRLFVQVSTQALYAETIALTLDAETDAPLAAILTQHPDPQQKLA